MYARDQLSIDRCFEHYFKRFTVIIKAKSAIDGANVLVGKTEWQADRDGVAVKMRESVFSVGNQSIRLKYLVVLDQPKFAKSNEPVTFKFDQKTVSEFKEWQGIYLAPLNAKVVIEQDCNKTKSSVDQSSLVIKTGNQQDSQVLMQALPDCLIKELKAINIANKNERMFTEPTPADIFLKEVTLSQGPHPSTQPEQKFHSYQPATHPIRPSSSNNSKRYSIKRKRNSDLNKNSLHQETTDSFLPKLTTAEVASTKGRQSTAAGSFFL